MMAYPKQEAAQAIRDWHASTVRVQEALAPIRTVMRPEPESEFNEAIYGAIEAHANALDRAYELDGWLMWWWCECRLGESPMEAAAKGQELHAIATIDDLIGVVLAGRDD